MSLIYLVYNYPLTTIALLFFLDVVITDIIQEIKR